jgi:hypothetical protein
MKKALLFLTTLLPFSSAVTGQITINASDMPVVGDTLRYSSVDPSSASINLSNTGANVNWDFSNWIIADQGVDTFKTPADAGFTGLNTGVGYRVSDAVNLSGQGLPLSLSDPHVFYDLLNGPDRYVAVSFAAYLNGSAEAAIYSDQDEIYFFPLVYNRRDTSTFRLDHATLMGSITMKGERVTVVDGYGTVKTPYFTNPVNVLRIRSEVWQTDSVHTVLGQHIGFERRYVEYTWRANGEHYPVVRVGTNVDDNGNETVQMVRFRDTYRPNVHIASSTPDRLFNLKAWPNPANDYLQLNVPANWNNYLVEIFDAQGKMLISEWNSPTIAIDRLARGNYIVRVQYGSTAGYTQICK